MNEASPMSLHRLHAVLDAYGAEPRRWPLEERAAAEALLAASPEARALQAEAARLDVLLDLAPSAEPSSALTDSILASLDTATETPRLREESGRGDLAATEIPDRTSRRLSSAATRRRPRRRQTWRWVGVAVPLAAAAALVLWLRSEPQRAATSPPVALAELSTYTTPTDALLEAPGTDTLENLPSFGCTDSGLGCVDPAPANNQSALDSERYV